MSLDDAFHGFNVFDVRCNQLLKKEFSVFRQNQEEGNEHHIKQRNEKKIYHAPFCFCLHQNLMNISRCV